MGWSGGYLVVAMGDDQVPLGVESLGDGINEISSPTWGWRYFARDRRVPVERFERAVDELARRTRRPFFGVTVEDSDYAYFFGGRDRVQWRLLLAAGPIPETHDGCWVARAVDASRASPEWQAEVADEIAAWSAAFPSSFSKAYVLERLSSPAVVANDDLRDFFVRLGLEVPPLA